MRVHRFPRIYLLIQIYDFFIIFFFSIFSIAQTTPTNPQNPPMNTAVIETLKKQLMNSEMQINELRTMVEKLSTENTRLKSQVIAEEVQL